MSDQTEADGLSFDKIGCNVVMSVDSPSVSWPPRKGVSVAVDGAGEAVVHEVTSSATSSVARVTRSAFPSTPGTMHRACTRVPRPTRSSTWMTYFPRSQARHARLRSRHLNLEEADAREEAHRQRRSCPARVMWLCRRFRRGRFYS